MDNRIQELVNLVRDKFMFKEYYLKRYSFRRNVNLFKETKYSLLMEWFPSDVVVPEDKELNPKGTAVVNLDIESKKVNHIIFVGHKSFVNDHFFANSNKEAVINWIENETGYSYEKDFKLSKEAEGKYDFVACIDGIKASPAGSINLEYDKSGNLVLFSVNGQFPRHNFVEKTKNILTLEQVEHIAEAQLKLIEIPSHLKERQIPIYGLEEIFIRKEGLLTIPFDVFEGVRQHYVIDELIYWDNPIKDKFQREDIELIEKISIDQVLSKEISPEARPINALQKTECTSAVKDFLRQVYPNDSGKWVLQTLKRDHSYINAVLKENEVSNNLLERKITVIIASENLKAINYVDNQPLIALMDEFTDINDIILSKKLAYEVIHEYIKLEPYYVYDFDQAQYILCGKLDCDYAVNANNGKVTLLGDVE